jgi:hypothetical protein
MADREVDENLWWLCHHEEEGGAESVEAELAELPREELERLLHIAVVELLRLEGEAQRQIDRFMRRFASRNARPS